MGDMIDRDAVMEILTSASGMRQKTIAAITALPAVTVGVKPLVWEDVDAICTRKKAAALGGHYSVVEFDAGTDESHYSVNIDLGGLAFVFILEPDPLGGRRPKRFSTLDAAQAAAQADYEARGRAMWEPQPTPDAAAIREAAQTIIYRVLQQASPEAAHLRKLMVNATMSIRHPSLTRYRRWAMVNEAIRTLAAALITEKPHDRA